MNDTLDAIGYKEYAAVLGFLSGIRLLVNGLRGLIIPAYYSPSGVEGAVTAKFAGIWYLFGDPRAKAVFYTSSVLLIIATSTLTYIYRKETRYVFTAVLFTTPIVYSRVVREYLQFGLDRAIIEMLIGVVADPISSTYILLVLYVAVSYRRLDIRQFDIKFDGGHYLGSAYDRWDLLGRAAGYTVIVIGLLVLIELLTGFPGVFLSPVESGSWGIYFVLGIAENPHYASELLTTATVLSLVLLFVFYVLRDGAVKIRWLLTVLIGFTTIPVFTSLTDTTAAIAAVFCLLFVSTTAFTISETTLRSDRGLPRQ